jgi:hypothetical protein
MKAIVLVLLLAFPLFGLAQNPVGEWALSVRA